MSIEEGEVANGACGDREILIADADSGFRRAAAHALAVTGLRIREVGSGQDALLAAEAEDVALAILEVRLPDMSGYEVCRRFREARGEMLPIVFVSGDRVESLDRVAGLLVGADDYLAKPVASDELIARVRRHLQRSFTTGGSSRSDLTARERQVLALLAEGLGPVEIGYELSISPKTVATHVEHIYAKLGVHTRAQAVASAFRLALVKTATRASV